MLIFSFFHTVYNIKIISDNSLLKYLQLLMNKHNKKEILLPSSHAIKTKEDDIVKFKEKETIFYRSISSKAVVSNGRVRYNIEKFNE